MYWTIRLPLPSVNCRSRPSGVVGVVDREAGLIDALRPLADGVVAELQARAVGIVDLGEQIGIGRIGVGERDRAAGVGGGEHVAVGVVGVGVGRSVGERLLGDLAGGVVRASRSPGRWR